MREKTEAKEMDASTGTHAPGTVSPLAKVVPIDEGRLDIFNPMKWSSADVELIKKTVCPSGIPDAEFKLFIIKCQASGMNPLLGEAFCVKRNQNIGTKDSPKWIEVFTFTPGEQGMEGRADDFPDFRGLRASAVYEKDKIVIDASSGEVSHQYDPAHDRGRLIGAWGLAYRDGRKTPVEFVRFDEYYDDRNPKWKSSPATMIVKCARAAALRRAYPNKFDGIYVREELRDDEQPLTPAQEEQAGRSTVDKLADRLKSTAKAQGDLGKAPPPAQQKAAHATVDVQVGKPPATSSEAQKAAGAITNSDMDRAGPPPVEEKKAPPADQGPLLIFGPLKNTPIKNLDGPQLLENIALGESKIATLDKEKQPKVRACIDLLVAERKAREAALLSDSEPTKQREPGEDDDF